MVRVLPGNAGQSFNPRTIEKMKILNLSHSGILAFAPLAHAEMKEKIAWYGTLTSAKAEAANGGEAEPAANGAAEDAAPATGEDAAKKKRNRNRNKNKKAAAAHALRQTSNMRKTKGGRSYKTHMGERPRNTEQTKEKKKTYNGMG